MLIKVSSEEMYTAIALVESLSKGVKLAYALVKCSDNNMSVCYCDENKRIIRKIPIEMATNVADEAASTEEIQFMVPVEKTLSILGHCRAAEGLTVDPMELELNKDGQVLSLSVVKRLSEAYGEEVGKEAGRFCYNISLGNISTPTFKLTLGADYDSIFDVTADSEEWDIGTLRESFAKLQVDKSIKNIYVVGKYGTMFSSGGYMTTQLFINDPTKKANYNLNSATVGHVTETLGKMAGASKVNVLVLEGGRFITFVSDKEDCALWVTGSGGNNGETTRFNELTHDSLKFESYMGVCNKMIMISCIDSIIGEDKNDTQKFEIVQAPNGEAVVKMSMVLAGGSMTNAMECILRSFTKADPEAKDFSSSLRIKTLRDIMTNCKNNWVGIRINCGEQVTLLRVSDMNGQVPESYHYTQLSV